MVHLSNLYMLLLFSNSVVSDSLRNMVYSTPGFPDLHHFSEFDQTYVHWVCDTIQPSHPLSFLSATAFNHYHHRCLFQRVSSSQQTDKALRFSFSISPSNEYSVLISFRIDWFALSAVQETPKSLLQHHSSKVLILQLSTSLWSNTQIQTWLLENHNFD